MIINKHALLSGQLLLLLSLYLAKNRDYRISKLMFLQYIFTLAIWSFEDKKFVYLDRSLGIINILYYYYYFKKKYNKPNGDLLIPLLGTLAFRSIDYMQSTKGNATKYYLLWHFNIITNVIMVINNYYPHNFYKNLGFSLLYYLSQGLFAYKFINI